MEAAIIGSPPGAERASAGVTRPQGAGWRRVRRQIAATLMVGAVFIAAVWLIIAAYVSAERRATFEHARGDANTLSAAFAEEMASKLGTATHLLDVIAARAQSDPDFDLFAWGQAFGMPAAPTDDALSIVAANGRLRATTRRSHVEPFDLSHRDYFTTLRDQTTRGLFFGLAQSGEMSDVPHLRIARRIESTDGHFLGVVAMSIPEMALTDLHRTAALPPGSLLVLLGTDRVIRARFGAGSSDATLGVGQHVPALPPAPADATTPLSFVRASIVDQTMRLYSFRRLPGLPLYAGVAFSLNEVLQPVAVDSRHYYAVGVLVTLALAALTGLLAVELYRRTDREMKLAAERATLAEEMRNSHAMQEQLGASEARLRDYAMMASDWFWEQDAELRFTRIGAETPLLAPGDMTYIGKRRWEMTNDTVTLDHWDLHRRELMARQPFRDFRYSQVGGDGRVHHVSISGVPVHDEAGTFIGYRGTGRDVTHEVDAAAELRGAKERAEKAEVLLRDAVDSISEGFVIYDDQDRLVLFNEAYRTLYPRSAEIMVPGTRFEDIISHGREDIVEGTERPDQYLQERLRWHRTARGGLEQQLSNGRWVLITERRMRDGGIAGLRIDITALKQTQIALSDSERRLRDFAETSSDWFWEQDAELRFNWIGESCPVVFSGMENYRGMRRWEFHSSRATSEEAWAQHRATLEARQPFRDFRYALWDDDGRLHHVTVSGKPVFDAAGAFLGYRGTGRDVSEEVEAAGELHHAKERAEQAEEMLRDAVDSISEGFVIYGPDDRLVMCNEAYRSLYAPGALNMVPGTRYEDVVRAVTAGGGNVEARGQEEEWLRRRMEYHRGAQGAIEDRTDDDRWLLVTDRRMRNGGIAGLRIDITALKQAQAALRESEERLARAQRIAGIGSWELDLRTGRYLWSKELYHIRGLSPDSFQPDIDNVARYVHPDDYPMVRRWLAALQDGLQRDTIETRILRPDGTVRTLHVEGRAELDADGSVRRLSGTMQDVTERRLMEQQLVQAQKMEAIGRLTGGMAHDFNNMLGVVIGNLELTRRRLKDDAMAIELLTEALDGARRGGELTRSLLAYARRQPLHPQPTSVNTLIEELARLLSRMLGENIQVHLKLGAKLPSVLVDPAQLEAAITNLATNAKDAMPQGGRLDITTKIVRLGRAYLAQHPEVSPGEYVLIEVSDTGTGIPKDVVGRIFEPFFTTKEPGRGSGLGLSMVFGFIKQSGGHVSVYTEEARGTTFRLYLPPVPTSAAVVEAPAKPAETPRGDETILLVEDNDALRRATARQLSELGYTLHEAANADAALHILRGTMKIDLLFTDVVMPGAIDGVSLAGEASRLRPEIKLLLTSGFPDVRFGDLPTLETRVQMLNKPYDLEQLAEAIRGRLDDPVLTGANA